MVVGHVVEGTSRPRLYIWTLWPPPPQADPARCRPGGVAARADTHVRAQLALVVQQRGVATLAGLERLHVVGHLALQELGGLGALRRSTPPGRSTRAGGGEQVVFGGGDQHESTQGRCVRRALSIRTAVRRLRTVAWPTSARSPMLWHRLRSRSRPCLVLARRTAPGISVGRTSLRASIPTQALNRQKVCSRRLSPQCVKLRPYFRRPSAGPRRC